MEVESALTLWRGRFEAFEKSGLSVKRWCASNNIPVDRYYYWRRKLSGARSRDELLPGFMAVDVVDAGAAQSASGGVTLRMGAAVIELQPDFDSVHLRRIIDVLEAGVGPACR